MRHSECNGWLQGCTEWMIEKSKRDWRPYYIEFEFDSSWQTATMPQIHDWMRERFYWPFCAEFVRDPRSKVQQQRMPQLWVFPGWRWGMRDCFYYIGDGNGCELQFRGIMMVPARSRFKGCPIEHIIKNQSEYTGRDIARVHVEAVDDIPRVVVSKVIKWGHADRHNILILPAGPAELLNDASPCHPREEIKRIQSVLNVSREVARELWHATREKEGLRIDPKTAQVLWECVRIDDPYDIEDDEVQDCTGDALFARAPGSHIWVLVEDLPKKVQKAILKRA